MPAQLIATVTNPAPPGLIHLPPNWWLRTPGGCNHLYFYQIRSLGRMCMYQCRNGPIWIGNNWHSYRIHLPNNSGHPCLPFPTNKIWYYDGGPISLEPVTRLQLQMESLWPVS
jgi:hypothetical protein